jgi:hypothetical protein
LQAAFLSQEISRKADRLSRGNPETAKRSFHVAVTRFHPFDKWPGGLLKSINNDAKTKLGRNEP